MNSELHAYFFKRSLLILILCCVIVAEVWLYRFLFYDSYSAVALWCTLLWVDIVNFVIFYWQQILQLLDSIWQQAAYLPTQRIKIYSVLIVNNLAIAFGVVIGLWLLVYIATRVKMFIAVGTNKSNLYELEQVKRFATGVISNEQGSSQSRLSLQISAIHSLAVFLNPNYKLYIRKQAFETLRSLLIQNHKRVLAQIKRQDFKVIQEAIHSDHVCRELNLVVEKNWRHILLEPQFDTTAMSLVGVRLPNKKIQYRLLNKVSLEGSDLRGVDLSGSSLKNANLSRCNLQSSLLVQTNLRNIKATTSSFSQANCNFANLSYANLVGSEWLLGSAFGAKFYKASLQDARMYKINASASTWKKARMQGITLYDCKLFGAEITYALIQAGNLAYSRFSGALIKHSNFDGCAENHIVSQGSAKFMDRVTQRSHKLASFGTSVFSGGYGKREFLQDEQLLKYMASNSLIQNKKYQKWRGSVLHHVESQPRYKADALLQNCRVSSYGDFTARLMLSSYKRAVRH